MNFLSKELVKVVIKKNSNLNFKLISKVLSIQSNKYNNNYVNAIRLIDILLLNFMK